jgi:hydroxyacylglutathione hydrolase
VIEVGQLRLEVMATPGHAPGHVCFYERSHDILFGGDLIIGGTVGRTDLPGADTAAMAASLQRVLRLPHKTVIYSGHSPPTTLQQELKSNPMLRKEWLKMLPLKERKEEL